MSLPGSVTFRPCALTHLRTAGISSAFPPFPSTTNGLIAPGPSHLTVRQLLNDACGPSQHNSPSSFAQFPTSEVGQATIAFSHVGFPAIGDCLSSVHSSAIHCKVFPAIRQYTAVHNIKRNDSPRPISSAMIHPQAPFAMSPVVHLYKN